MDYEKDLYIDESALDVEWLGQAPLMMRYCRELAKAEKEMVRLKEKMKVEWAILDKDIRTNPADFQIIKITEAAVQSAIIMDKDYQGLSQELIEAQFEFNMLKGAVDSIKMRKDALQDLVKLHGQQYFAGPTIPRDLTFEAKQRFAKETANSTIKIRRKK